MGAIGSWFGRFIGAAHPDLQKRKYIYSSPQDTRLDVTTASRRYVLGRARQMYYNEPIVRGIIDTLALYAVGSHGIKCQARTADEDWNKATEEWFHNWSLACDVRGLLSFTEMQKVATKTLLRDNELFIILTDSGDGFPQLQLVESHRCETPAYLSNEKRVSDGVRVNPQGRPLSYYIRTGDGDKFTEVQAADVIVLAERDRPDELRSLSKLVTCLNHFQDRAELIEYSMLAAKRAGSVGLALEGTGTTGFFGPDTTTDEGLTTDKILGGGAIWNLPAGKTLRELRDDRPSQNLQEFQNIFVRDACIGLGVPVSFIQIESLSGPTQRAVLAQAQRRIDDVSEVLISQMVARVRLWALAKAIKRGDLTPPRGMDRWWSAVYHTSKRTTIDAGRDSAADREDFKLGIKTLADISAERGHDWQEIVDQRVVEQVYIREKAQEAGVPVEEIQNTGKPALPGGALTPPSARPEQDQTVQPELADPTITVTMSAPVEVTDDKAEAEAEPEEVAPKTETFSMKDDPDYQLTDGELNMVTRAIGLQDKKKENELTQLAKPSEAMVAEAKRGLAWRKEHGRGGTAVGVARARDIINRVDFPDETIARIHSYLARHEVDKKGQGFSPGEPGYPSAGRIAWALWGGDAGQTWAAAQMRRIRQLARPGPKSKSQTPAPAKDRIRGSDQNKPGSAADRSTGGSIEVSESTEQTLKDKLADFRKKHPSRKAPSLGTLKKVYRRGAGAYSQSHRPTIGGGAPNSRGAWAIARVNKFLVMAGGGAVKKSYRDADGDLL